MSVQKLAGLIQRLFNTGYVIPQLTCVHSEVSMVNEAPVARRDLKLTPTLSSDYFTNLKKRY